MQFSRRISCKNAVGKMGTAFTHNQSKRRENERFERANSQEFLRRFITVDEPWVHNYTQETSKTIGRTVFQNSGGSASKKA